MIRLDVYNLHDECGRVYKEQGQVLLSIHETTCIDLLDRSLRNRRFDFVWIHLVLQPGQRQSMDSYSISKRSDGVMTSINPSSLTWTLRFKYHKSTILLHVDPNQSVESLKENLLYALRDVKPSPEFLNGRSPPSSASQIKLAKPVNPLDVSEGWEPLEAFAVDDEEDDDDGDGKGKGKGKVKSMTEAFGQIVTEIGIKDHSVLAFRWEDTEDPAVEDEDEAMDEGEWDVVIPTFNDTYGMGNVVDDEGTPEQGR